MLENIKSTKELEQASTEQLTMWHRQLDAATRPKRRQPIVGMSDVHAKRLKLLVKDELKQRIAVGDETAMVYAQGRKWQVATELTEAAA